MSMTHDEMIAVIQAHKEGKELQWQPSKDSEFNKWQECGVPVWDFRNCKYRVKPAPPKPHEFWLLRDKIYQYPDEFCDSGNWNVGGKPIHVREVLPSEERA
jgi:hypothetical protein